MTELELLKTAVQSPKILREIYGDLAKPGVQQAGKALGTIIGLGNTALWPISLLNERTNIALKQNLENYRVKMESVPEEEVCEVAPEVGVPIAEKLAYVTNKELSEMYAELLAKASQTQKSGVAHPSFANIINNMSPDEAKLLKAIQGMRGIPFVSVRLKWKGKNEWSTIVPVLLDQALVSGLHYPHNAPAYLSNLEGLGILDIRTDIFMVGDELYESIEIEATKTYSKLTEFYDERELDLNRGKIEITALGSLFLQACFSSEPPS